MRTKLSKEDLIYGKFLIYSLLDPRTKEIRYIGRSSTGLLRPRSHNYPSNLKKMKTALKTKLAAEGKTSTFQGKTHTKEWRETQSQKTKGVPKTEESCQKMKESHTGVPLSEDHAASIKKGHDNKRNIMFFKRLCHSVFTLKKNQYA